jgi:hypothetical protein
VDIARPMLGIAGQLGWHLACNQGLINKPVGISGRPGADGLHRIDPPARGHSGIGLPRQGSNEATALPALRDAADGHRTIRRGAAGHRLAHEKAPPKRGQVKDWIVV